MKALIDVGGLEVGFAFVVVAIISTPGAIFVLFETIVLIKTATSSFASQIEIAAGVLMVVAAARLAGHLVVRTTAAPLIW